MRIDFNKDETVPHLLPKAHQLLPAKKFEEQLQAGASLSLGLNEQLEFTAGTPHTRVESILSSADGQGPVGAEINAKLGLAGGFTYSIKKAKIDNNSAGMEWVMWRLDGAEFFQETPPLFIIILSHTD